MQLHHFFEVVSFVIFYQSVFIVQTQAKIPTFYTSSSKILSDDVQSWTHEILIDNGMELFWNANDPEWLIMEISAPTTGYLGVGFSPNGGMAGSDIFLGHVDDSNGTPHLHDYYAEANAAPKLDKSQDTELIVAVQTENRTLIRFRRKWDTCDEEHDIKLTGDDTFYLIWAYSPYDPTETLHWHGPITRGVRSVFLRTVQTARQFPDEVPIPGVHHLDFSFPNLHVPQQETTYHCRIVKIPAFEKKRHIIGYRALIEPRHNAPYIHHITLYKCGIPSSVGKSANAIFDKFMDHPGDDCLTNNVPFEWKMYCFAVTLASLVGSEGDMFPDHVGIPIMPGEDTFFRFEIHYDNIGLHKIVDSSGLRLFYTDEVRDGDIGSMFLGNKVTPFQVIPQNLKKFTTYTFCSADCTKSAFPESGVKIIGVLLHAHKAGIAIRLRHIRDGNELVPIAVDNHYNFNYQQYRTLPNEVKILPGDALIVECDYSSLGATDTIIGGFPSQREMCQAFLWLYPSVDVLTDCRTQIEFHSFFNALDMENVSNRLLSNFRVPYVIADFTEHEKNYCPLDDSYILATYFEEYRSVSSNPWKHIIGTYKNQSSNESAKSMSVYQALLKKSSNAKNAEILQNKWRNGDYYVSCMSADGRRLNTGKDLNEEIIQKLPNFVPYDANKLGPLSGLSMCGVADKVGANSGSFIVSSNISLLTYVIASILITYG